MTLRDRLLDLWYALKLSHLLLAVVPLLLVAGMGTIVHIAYTGFLDRQAAIERQSELRCLATNVYHEARGEPLTGQLAVAEVTLNRMRSPRFPDSVCDVVYERRLDPSRGRYVGAFSWTDQRPRPPYGKAWAKALDVATRVYDGQHQAQVPQALFYHARRVRPAWSKVKQPLASIGDHVFYP